MNIYPCGDTVREDNATGDVRGRPWGWHGFGVARAGLVGNGDPRSLPTAGRLLCGGRVKCLSCPDRPSAAPVQDRHGHKGQRIQVSPGSPSPRSLTGTPSPRMTSRASLTARAATRHPAGSDAPQGGCLQDARRPSSSSGSVGALLEGDTVLAVLAVICSCAALIELTREVGRS